MSENFHYYGKHKRTKSLAIPTNVIQKGKTFQIRADYELTKLIQGLAKELNQKDAKVIKDILRDFFLDQKLKRQQFEISDIN